MMLSQAVIWHGSSVLGDPYPQLWTYKQYRYPKSILCWKLILKLSFNRNRKQNQEPRTVCPYRSPRQVNNTITHNIQLGCFTVKAREGTPTKPWRYPTKLYSYFPKRHALAPLQVHVITFELVEWAWGWKWRTNSVQWISPNYKVMPGNN